MSSKLYIYIYIFITYACKIEQSDWSVGMEYQRVR